MKNTNSQIETALQTIVSGIVGGPFFQQQFSFLLLEVLKQIK